MTEPYRMSSCFLCLSKESDFLRGPTPGEDAVKTNEVTKDSDYDTNVVNVTAAGLARVDSTPILKNPVNETLSNSITSYREVAWERKSE